jgi:hypothetical protein
MDAHALLQRPYRFAQSRLVLPVALIGLAVIAATAFIFLMLWPTWSNMPVALDVPAIPVTVADTLFEVPPAAIRAAVQRHAGPHDRIDLAFMWPALTPPPAAADGKPALPSAAVGSDTTPAPSDVGARLFVTVAPLGNTLPPAKRLRTIYTRYVEGQAFAGPNGLAILPFRAGSPYAGEDLVYLADNAEQFFARCTRQTGAVPGTCLHERLVGSADVTLRFARNWLDDWRNVATGFDRLLAQLQPPGSR